METLDNLRNEGRLSTRIFVNQVLDRNDTCLSRATNISRNGMHILSLSSDLGNKRFVWLLFWVPTSEELIRALGEVVHCTERNELFSVGIKFKWLSPRHNRILEEYLAAEEREQLN